MILSIISGKWRKTPILVSKFRYLKPTQMIIKKTLFNWLGSNLSGMNCLDLFAGSGSLGFEAASRLASKVVLIEKNKFLFNYLLKFKKNLSANNVIIFNTDFIKYISINKFTFYDLIFIDPPYKNLNILVRSIQLSINILNFNGLIYIETLLSFNILNSYFNFKLKIFRKSNIGNINFFLFKIKKS